MILWRALSMSPSRPATLPERPAAQTSGRDGRNQVWRRLRGQKQMRHWVARSKKRYPEAVLGWCARSPCGPRNSFPEAPGQSVFSFPSRCTWRRIDNGPQVRASPPGHFGHHVIGRWQDAIPYVSPESGYRPPCLNGSVFGLQQRIVRAIDGGGCSANSCEGYFAFLAVALFHVRPLQGHQTIRCDGQCY